MSENLNRGTRDFSKYDTMATADLEEILRLDAESPEGTESDTELLLYVMGVLADRRRNSGNAGKTAFEAWESFEKNYMPAGDTCEDPAQKSGSRTASWLRRAAAAAAVIALLVCIPLSARAFDLGELWDIFAHWAKETFSFVSDETSQVTEPDPVNQEEYTSLQDALIKSNRDPSIIPTWIPDGYILKSIDKNVSPVRETFSAFYVKDSKTIKILVQTYLDTDPGKVEVSEDLIEIYPSSGTDYYLFSNVNHIQVIWIKDSYECNISGDISIDEAKSIIDSIGKE